MIFGKKRSNLSDEALIERYQKDLRKRWVGELFNRHAHLVFGVCMKYLKNEPEAKDATIGIFEKLMKDLETAKVDRFSSWIYTVSKNHCLMILRKQNHPDRRKFELNGTEVAEVEEADDKVLNELKYDSLEQAIGELKDDQRVCIRLFYLERKSYKEIVDQTDYNLKEVKSHIQNGKRNLKLKLSEYDAFRQ